MGYEIDKCAQKKIDAGSNGSTLYLYKDGGFNSAMAII